MSVATAVVLILLGWASLAAMMGAVVLVVRDGRGQIPLESPDGSWTAGSLPSRPYSTLRV